MGPASLLFLLAAGAMPALGQDTSTPTIRLARHLFLGVQIFGARPGASEVLARGTIEASPGRPGRLSIPLEFPAGREPRVTSIEIEAETDPEIGSRPAMLITSTATVHLPGGGTRRLVRDRRAEVEEGSSLVHQLYENRSRDESLIATITAEFREVPELVPPSAGPAVAFLVNLVRIAGSLPESIDEQILRTLSGESVSYSFSRTRAPAPEMERLAAQGPSPLAGTDLPFDDLLVTLLPKRSEGEILVVEAAVAARLGEEAGGSGRKVLVRRTQAVTNGSTFDMPFSSTEDGSVSYRLVVKVQF